MHIDINHNNITINDSYYLEEIPNGTYFYGSVTANKNYTDKLFLKTFHQVVLVENPENTWDSSRIHFSNVQFVKVIVSVEKNLTRDEV